MSKEEIMLTVNRILEVLDFYNEDFIDRVVSAIADNDPFTDEEIAELS